MLLFSNHELVGKLLSTSNVQIAVWFASTVRPLIEQTATTIGGWWQPFVASLRDPSSRQESWYAYLFATGIFGLALMPALIYLWGRLVKRLFP